MVNLFTDFLTPASGIGQVFDMTPKDKNGRFEPLFRFGADFDGTPIVFCGHPDGLKQILTNPADFKKAPFIYQNLKLILGEGLVITEGARWRRDRRLLTPIFHFERLRAMIDRTVWHAQNLVKQLEQRWSDARIGSGTITAALASSPPESIVVNVTEEVTQFTMAVMIDLGFGGDFDAKWMAAQWSLLLHAFSNYMLGSMIFGRVWKYLPVPWAQTPQRYQRAILASIHRAVQKRKQAILETQTGAKITDKGVDSSTEYDLLSALVHALIQSENEQKSGVQVDETEKAEPMTLQDVADQAETFLFAGTCTKMLRLREKMLPCLRWRVSLLFKSIVECSADRPQATTRRPRC